MNLLLVWRWSLDEALDQHYGFSSDALGPPNHSLRDEIWLLGQDTLYGGELVSQDDKHDLGACMRPLALVNIG